MKIIKNLRQWTWNLLNKLPDHIAEQWVRNKVRINSKELENFTIKVANTQDEFEQGYRLLYECYLAQGYQSEQPDFPLRITKYHLMPTSTMFIVKDKDQVVATLTHIIDSKIGLPVDKAVDLSDIRKKNIRIAEISALAIKKGYRRNTSIIFALTRIVYHFSVQYAGCDAWVICVSSYVDLYYRALFFFKKIISKEFKYDFVNGQKSSCLHVELNELPTLFKYFYGQAEESKNMYQFYVQEWGNIFQDFPEAIIRGATTPTLSIEMIQHFFKDKTAIWADLTDQEKIEVINAYYDESILGSDEVFVARHIIEKRSSARRLTNIRAEIVQPVGVLLEYISCLIVNVSEKGFLLKTEAALENHMIYNMLVQATSNLKLSVSFQILRSTKENYYACVVTGQDLDIWQNYYRKIEEFCLSFKKFKVSEVSLEE